MNKEEMNKYGYELMIKNNPEEAVKNLLLKDKENKKISIQHLATLNKLIETQQENENLKDYLKIMEKGKDNNLNRFLDYKSRNEKAIEYIKKEIADIEFMKKEYSDYDKIGEIEVKLKSIEELNDILNGGDE